MLSPDDRPKKKSKAKAKRNEDIFDPENEIDSPVIKFTGSTRAFNTTEIDSLRTEKADLKSKMSDLLTENKII